MPIPKPTGSETEDEFMGRCMEDQQMQSEYGRSQRTAVCLDSFRGKDKEKMSELENFENHDNETKYLDINCEWKIEQEEDDDTLFIDLEILAQIRKNKTPLND